MEIAIEKSPKGLIQIKEYLKQLYTDIQDIPNIEIYMTDIVELILEYDSLVINCIKNNKLSWQERSGNKYLDFDEANEESAKLEAELASKATQAADLVFPISQYNDEQKKQRRHFIDSLFTRENAIKRIEQSIPNISFQIPTGKVDIQVKKAATLGHLAELVKNSQPYS